MNQFESINEFIKHHKLDMSHWINAEALKYTKRKVFDKKIVKLTHTPKELLDYELTCSQGHRFIPNWLGKRFPTSVFFSNKAGLIRQTHCFVKCPQCDEHAVFNIPDVECTGNLNIYGDEAFRTVDNKTVLVYSFCSFSGNRENFDIFQSKFWDLKKSLSPSFSPDDWVLHMKELLCPEKRLVEPALAHLKSHEVIDIISKIIDLISIYTQKMDLNLYCSVGVVKGINLKKHHMTVCKESTYTSSLIHIIKETTDHGIAPKFYFERTGSDGWAKNLFDSGRMTLLWPWVTNGLPVMSPKFVKPSFSFFLEIADIVSYIVARHLYCIGKRVEGGNIKAKICPSQLGLVRYILTDAQGDWRPLPSIGFPDAAMFKGTHWEKFI